MSNKLTNKSSNFVSSEIPTEFSHLHTPLGCVSIVIEEDDEEQLLVLPHPIQVQPIQPQTLSTTNDKFSLPLSGLKKATKDKATKDKTKATKEPLKYCFDTNENIIEIGIDEAGRGPLFGRVYCGVVVLPKHKDFDVSSIKDSKKFHSAQKITQVSNYIKENSIWAVEYEDEQVIDSINILQATQSAMHKGIRNVLKQLEAKGFCQDNVLLLIDGNYFNPFDNIKHVLIEGGDNKYSSIAAASILAKVERDKYIEELCLENPELAEKYGIDSNKGYGTKTHLDGIRQHGITQWHRKSFGICKSFV